MLNKQRLIERYQENYQMAIEEGHAEDATKIAWEWTEEEMMRLFYRYSLQHIDAHQEAINKAHFG